ncbi:MAG TPA: LysM domain-containing protein [Bryobacteraceae bacterium]|jgi:nucleoid-associated protein YgaU|nr:LysM domain-containing protein [Bryobacteraceae bacterium]
MRKILGIAAMVATLSMAGCQLVQQQPKPQMSSESVLDVRPARPTPSRFAQPVQVATPPVEPTVAIANDPAVTQTPDFRPARSARPALHKPAAAEVQMAADKASYKVKKGDTLYRIARTEYGDGKKWTLIASANPGLSPRTLKTGQTIVIP